MVGLHGAYGNQCIRALGDCVGDQEFQFAGLVPAGRQAGQVVALDEQIGTAQCAAQARHRLDRSGTNRVTAAIKFRQQFMRRSLPFLKLLFGCIGELQPRFPE